MRTYWISFVASGIAQGVVIVEAASPREALERVTRLGQNPGGEAMVVEVPDEPDAVEEVGMYPRDELLSPEDLLTAGAIRVGDAGEHDPEKGPPVQVTMVCEPCNEARVPRA